MPNYIMAQNRKKLSRTTIYPEGGKLHLPKNKCSLNLHTNTDKLIQLHSYTHSLLHSNPILTYSSPLFLQSSCMCFSLVPHVPPMLSCGLMLPNIVRSSTENLILLSSNKRSIPSQCCIPTHGCSPTGRA